VAGWTLWNTPGGKFAWAIVAGLASIGAIIHGSIRVPSHVKAQEELRKEFGTLRLGLEGFFYDIALERSMEELKPKFDKLHEEYKKVWERSRPDILGTMRLQRKVQDKLDLELKKRGML